MFLKTTPIPQDGATKITKKFAWRPIHMQNKIVSVKVWLTWVEVHWIYAADVKKWFVVKTCLTQKQQDKLYRKPWPILRKPASKLDPSKPPKLHLVKDKDLR